MFNNSMQRHSAQQTPLSHPAAGQATNGSVAHGSHVASTSPQTFSLPVSKRVYDYYTANPQISFDSMNVILLNFIEQVSGDMSKLMTTTLNGEILAQVKELRSHITTLNDSFAAKLHEHNKAFVDNVKLVISLASSENTDKITSFLSRTTEQFVDRITRELPKTSDDTQRKVQATFMTFQQQLAAEFKALVASNSSQSQLREFAATIDAKLSQMQQPLLTLMSATQEQFSTKLTGLRDEHKAYRDAQDKLQVDLQEFLSKFKSNVQYKGQCSEQVLEQVLNRLYPTADIQNTSGFRAQGDLMMRREKKPMIMFENKHYDGNVPTEEVKKFLRDINEQHCSGILLSECSGIVGKANYGIEVHDGHVLMYLHNVDYNQEKIKLAVDIIDHLSAKLNSISEEHTTHGLNIPKDVLDKINEQYQQFIASKENLTSTAKDIQKRLLVQIEQLALPDLSDYLRMTYATTNVVGTVTCEQCGEVFTNKRSLASHKKKHKPSGAHMLDDLVVNDV